ncbi:GDSL-type esterase/lipase family protein [Jiulongibacter sp. NS-SX5]|uniref:GDSL-type esterase/lipase family protein n=1 Tax=Jiulongibacter sp. NS-SX5 TaxID=3463854 RepID=UPI004059366F
MEEFREEVAELAKARLENIPDKPIVFYGSSSFRLWESLQEDIPEFPCLNLAFGGSQIKHCNVYFDQLIGQTKPQRIFFYCGDNDIADEVSPRQILERFKRFNDLVNEHFPGVPLTFLSIKPSPIRNEKIVTIQEANQLIEGYLKGKENRYYLDIHHEMLAGKKARPELFTEDELHMNPAGYQIWTKKVREHLDLPALDMAMNS